MVHKCVEYTTGGISVGLPLEKYCDTLAKCTKWKNLPEEEFIEKCGNNVLAQYHMPTEAEIDQLAEYEVEEEEEEEEEEEGSVGARDAGEGVGETSKEVLIDL